MRANTANISVRVDPGERYSARVRILFSGAGHGERFIWFLDEYGSARGLAGRVQGIGLLDASGRKVAERKFLPGERIDTSRVGGLEYRIWLKQPETAFPTAHVSWVGSVGGMLMLDDLLPQGLGREAVMRLDLPAGWKTLAPGAGQQSSEFKVSNIQKTAISIGPAIRETRARTSVGETRVGISGDWLFTDKDVTEMATAIADEYGRLIGKETGPEFTISIARFPFDAGIGQWEADTRGSSVTIFSSDMPFRNQSLQRLHEQLRHEIFHLWIPNSVNLTGQYDWFYEGFALYQSLRTGVELNQLRFEDYLDTISRAYNIDAREPRPSLINASRDRWSGDGTRVYARGMLVAFLCDLILLDRSKGKLSASDIVRDVFLAHRAGGEVDGNAAVLAVMRKHPELRPIIDKYITGSEMIEWDDVVRSAGLRADRNGRTTVLGVDQKASSRAKKTRQILGIDNWRRGPKR